MKKALALTLATLLALTLLAGCASGDKGADDAKKPDVTTPDTTTPDTTTPDTTTPDTTTPDTTTPDAAEFSHGTWSEDGVYTSEYSGLTFKNPETWQAYDDETLAAAMQIAYDEDTEMSDFEKDLAQQVTIQEMMTQDLSTGNNVIIMYENLEKQMAQALITADKYLTVVSTQLGEGYTIGEKAKATICGKEFDSITVSTETEGMQISQTFYAYKMDKYMLCIVVSTLDDSLDTIMACFE